MWFDEKRRHYIQQELARVEQKARTSQKRSIIWGSLATLFWISIVVRMPPIQRAKTIWPHIGMIVAATSISKTVGDNLKRAGTARQASRQLSQQIKICRNQADWDKIQQDMALFRRQYDSFLR